MIELGPKLTKTAFKKSQKQTKKAGQGSNPFSDTLDRIQNKDVSAVLKELSGEVGLSIKDDVTALKSESIEKMNVNDAASSETDVTKKISDILGEVNDGQNKLQRLMDIVTSGTKLSPQELIAVQAGVFSLIQELELVGKATQEATQGVRQTLNTQIG